MANAAMSYVETRLVKLQEQLAEQDSSITALMETLRDTKSRRRSGDSEATYLSYIQLQCMESMATVASALAVLRADAIKPGGK